MGPVGGEESQKDERGFSWTVLPRCSSWRTGVREVSQGEQGSKEERKILGFVFEDERDLSRLNADGKEQMKESGLKMREAERGCCIEGAGPRAQVWGLPEPGRPTPLPCDRLEGAEGRAAAARFGGS